MEGNAFRFAYNPPVVRLGEGCVGTIRDELADHGLERALVVCGSTVGDTPAVIDPVTAGLGDRLADVFAETTPEKRLSTAVDGARAFRDADADAIVSLGGGSSLDTSKVISLVVASDRNPAQLGDALDETGTLPVDGDPVPIVAIPTTLAGADLTSVAGVTATPAGGFVEQPVSGGVGDLALMPRAVVYDTALLATTPRDILAASAMNGFDKGIETLYASTATPLTDATAIRGLQRFREGLLAFARGDESDGTYRALAEGVLLVQYGISRPETTTLSVIHAFGHALTRTYPLQQGTAHGIVAPHVLAYVFERVDGRRELLADGLNVAGASDTPTAIVDAVRDVRDALDLPGRLRDVDGPTRDDFDEIAQDVLDDDFMTNAPSGLDPDIEGIRAVLEAAW